MPQVNRRSNVSRRNTGTSLSSSEDTVSKIEKSLNRANAIKLENAFELAAQKKLGKALSKVEIEGLAQRTADPAVAARLMCTIANASEKETFIILARLAIGLSSNYLNTAGVTTAATRSVLPVVIGSFFVNRIIEDASGTLAKINQLDEIPISNKLVSLFESFWGSLDLDDLKQKTSGKMRTPQETSEEVSSESSRVTFRTHKQKDVYTGGEKVSYLCCVGGDVCGVIRWDKKLGDPNPKGSGWIATLFHGFNEAAFRSGKGENTNEPYTAVHNNEVKLHNPQRLSLELAKTWARSALR